jgi:hypothetical protein
VGTRCADHVTPVKVGTNFADRRRPLCRYSFFRGLRPRSLVLVKQDKG